MKKKLAISILLVAILLGAISMTALVMRNSKQSSHSAPPSSSSHKQESYEKTIELDQVYKESDDYAIYYHIFKSDGTYVSIQDRANIYKTQADLDKAGNEEEMAVTPIISCSIGSYQFVDQTVEISYDNSTEIDFSTVDNIKAGNYFEIEYEDGASKVIWKKKKNGYFDQHGYLIKLHKIDYTIPDSEADFLSQYTYAPETKDDWRPDKN